MLYCRMRAHAPEQVQTWTQMATKLQSNQQYQAGSSNMMTERENFATEEDIDAILAMKRVAVVGLSSDPSRPSNDVARYLQRRGYTIIPVNPTETQILGEQAYASLAD